MSPLYDLTNEEAEAVYLALTGVVSLPLLQKTKKALQEQRLFHAVEEVNERLRLYEGIGTETVGLLRIFNPQHDMIAESTPRPGSKSDKSKAEHDPHTRDMFAEREMRIEGDGHGEPLAQAWDDTIVPKPRPEPGQLVLMPTGQSTSIVDVLGWDVEREAFRVVDAGGWDGHVVSYGQRDQVEWRMLNQLLDYHDASDKAKEPLGSPAALAADLRAFATLLLAGPEEALPGNPFAGLVEDVLPLLNAIAPDHIAPDYIREYVTRDVAEMPDNAHALARLCIQYAETAEAAQHGDAEGLDGVVAAAHDGAALAFDGEQDTEWRGAALAPSVDDAATEQALAEGTYEPESVELGWTDSEGAVAGVVDVGGDGERRVHDYAAPAAPEPSAQQKRNAARAGTKAKAVAKGGKGKRGK